MTRFTTTCTVADLAARMASGSYFFGGVMASEARHYYLTAQVIARREGRKAEDVMNEAISLGRAQIDAELAA